MKEQDSLHRFVFENSPVRGEIVNLDATWRAVLEKHPYPLPLQTLLGEMMAAAALLAATLKFSGTLIMQMHGSGSVKLLVVECTSEMTMRATAKWDGEIADGPISELLGEGRFVITIDPEEEGKQSYQGIVSLEGGTVSEVLESYMQRSEQLETRLWLEADAGQAAGMLLQKLPQEENDEDDAWNRAVHLGSTISREELLNLPATEIMFRLFHEEDIRAFERTPVSFRCSCSQERVANMLRMLGPEEVHSILDELKTIEVDCEFCNRHYSFDAVDAEQLFVTNVISAVPPTVH